MLKIFKSGNNSTHVKPNVTFNLNNSNGKEERKDDLIIILRGHIRNTFENNHLYNFLCNLNDKYNLYIFIHTWNIKSNDLSWRNIQEDTSVVDDSLIIEYFKNLNIEKMFIDDDKCIEIRGKKSGLIKTTLMPIHGWKNMWYGIHKICQYILDNLSDYNLNEKTFTMNIRFDYFNNSTLKQYTKHLHHYEFTNRLFDFSSQSLEFLKNPPFNYGIDNIYTGNFFKIYYTARLFHTRLDEIIEGYKKIHAQENLVYLLQEYVDKYCDELICDEKYVESTINFIILKLHAKLLINNPINP
jgi:hypothetical protein